MSPEPVTAERVYQRLKADLLGGRYPPGAALRLQDIADLLGVSSSPVRDSAQRLIGERLVEAQPGGGFAVPQVTEASLRDLYVWHGHLVRQALKSRVSLLSEDGGADPSLAGPHDAAAVAAMAATIFTQVGRRSHNGEHVHAIMAAGDRLAFIRLIEPRVLADAGKEIQLVAKLTVFGPDAALRDAVWAYHRRRIRTVSRIVREMLAAREAV